MYNMNYVQSLTSKLNNDDNIMHFCIHHKIIKYPQYCDSCRRIMSLNTNESSSLGFQWRCNKCFDSKSFYDGSLLSKAKISLQKILIIFYCWLYQFPHSQAELESGIKRKAIGTWYFKFRKLCSEKVQNTFSQQIGGPEFLIQIDETLVSRRKNHVGRVLLHEWIIGGIIPETKEFFCQRVPDRTSNTLRRVIEKNVKFGTIIVTDCWSGYNFLNNPNSGYFHLTVNHTYNFIDPITLCNTQSIERQWLELKTFARKHRGIARNHLDSYIFEYIWRKTAKRLGKLNFYDGLELLSR